MLDHSFSTELFDRTPLRPRPKPAPLTLDQVLPGLSGLPQGALVLGLCQDDLPLVIDLADPDSGSVLIASDTGFDNTAFLHCIVAGALALNQPEDLSLHLISPYADELLTFHRQPSFRICYEPYRPEVEVVLEEMVNLVVGRQRKQTRWPYHVLAVDDLDLLCQSISPQGKLRLQWLVEHGPGAGLWVLGTLDSTYLSEGLAALIERFPSRLLGQICQPNLARSLSRLNGLYLADLTPGEAYFVGPDQNSIHLQAIDLAGTEYFWARPVFEEI
jgi:hypothetical protein